jgi:MerR family transcriptional regulator, light-induced transcriptional regulator
MPESHLALASLSRVTGLSPHVIRVWERRYGFPAPDRTGGGHRRYSTADAERLRQAAVLTRSGMRAADAIAMVRDQRVVGAGPSLASTSVPTLVGHLVAGEKLASLIQLREAWLALGLATTLETVVFPALREVGRRWAAGEISVSAEHAASGVVLSWLGSLRAEFPWKDRPVSVLIAALEGEEHFVALWALELLLAEGGISALALAGTVPIRDVVAEAARRHARILVLGLARVELKPGLRRAVRLLDELPASQRPQLFVGGAGAQAPLPAGAQQLGPTVSASATQLVAELKAATGRSRRRELRSLD